MTDGQLPINNIGAHGSSAADWTIAGFGAVTFAASWLQWVDSAEKIVIGALTILLLALRVRAHLRPGLSPDRE
ncbi:MAG: hypothetical protein JWL84_321 [Rhodospirillales bacterium]|jgi:hypothetical protein|nr:hypothetical protein [Rhodospirillales bacterium]